MWKTAGFILLFSIIFCLVLGSAKPLYASDVTCTAAATPTGVSTGTQYTQTFTVTNTGSVDIQWIEFSVPSNQFTIISTSLGNWTVSHDESSLVISGGTLASGASLNPQVTVQTGNTDAESADWTVQAAAQPSGNDPEQCSGNLGVAITGAPADTQGPAISDITVSGITDKAATLGFTTDEAATIVFEYGLSDEYGLSSSLASATHHALTLSGLTANTTYHFTIRARDGSGNPTETNDATFTTASAGSTIVTQTVTTTVTNTLTRTVTPTPSPTPIPDRAPPSVRIQTTLEKSYTAAPSISGTASDPSGVDRVSYSTDGGKNWINAGVLTPKGKGAVTFRFTPEIRFDDSYELKIKSWDTLGNAGVTAIGTIVIDRLAPEVATVFLSYGPSELTPNDRGIVELAEATAITLTVSAVGGPSEISVNLNSEDAHAMYRTPVSLRKNAQSGLWSAQLPLDGTGVYALTSQSRDGAQNITSRTIASIFIKNRGTILGSASAKPVPNAAIRVYARDGYGAFQPWYGQSYGTANPLVTASGKYGIILPAGTYYLDVSAEGYKTATSEVFTLNRPTPILTDIRMEELQYVHFAGFSFPVPYSRPRLFPVPNEMIPDTVNRDTGPGLVDKPFPGFRLPRTTGELMSDLDLRGKTTLISILALWHPLSVPQIAAMESAQRPERNIVAVVSAESPDSAKFYKKRVGATFPMIADADGSLVKPLASTTVPMHIVINRNGIITAVRYGYISESVIGEIMSD
jgi:hypothetical protein